MSKILCKLAVGFNFVVELGMHLLDLFHHGELGFTLPSDGAKGGTSESLQGMLKNSLETLHGGPVNYKIIPKKSSIRF